MKSLNSFLKYYIKGPILFNIINITISFIIEIRPTNKYFRKYIMVLIYDNKQKIGIQNDNLEYF